MQKNKETKKYNGLLWIKLAVGEYKFPQATLDDDDACVIATSVVSPLSATQLAASQKPFQCPAPWRTENTQAYFWWKLHQSALSKLRHFCTNSGATSVDFQNKRPRKTSL